MAWPTKKQKEAEAKVVELTAQLARARAALAACIPIVEEGVAESDEGTAWSDALALAKAALKDGGS